MADANGAEVARLTVSPARRVFGLGVMLALAGLVLWLGLAGVEGGGFAVRGAMVLLGLGVLAAAVRMQRATQRALILTETVLVDTAGVVLTRVDDIEGVDRGTFAFKPSNGFLLKTRTKGTRAWQPGLYWRFGRRIGVGGVAQAAQAKAMADALTVVLVERKVAERSEDRPQD